MVDYSKMESKQRAEEFARYIQDRLLNKEYTVHRCDSKTTDSIYLKVDYGVGGGVRISDHKGRQRINYRFNLRVDCSGRGIDSRLSETGDKHYYNYDSIDRLVDDLIKFRESRVKVYGGLCGYIDKVKREKRDWNKTDEFWKNAIELKPNIQKCNKKWLKRNRISIEQMDNITAKVCKEDINMAKLVEKTRGGWVGLCSDYLDIIIEKYNGDYK